MSSSHLGLFMHTVTRGQMRWPNISLACFTSSARRYARPPLSPTRATNSPSARASNFKPVVYEAARLYQLPVTLLRAVMHVESHFDLRVVSVDGAMGLMQLMPFTAQKMGVRDPFDPQQNIVGAQLIKLLQLIRVVHVNLHVVERRHGDCGPHPLCKALIWLFSGGWLRFWSALGEGHLGQLRRALPG
jgi:hypothetical protein